MIDINRPGEDERHRAGVGMAGPAAWDDLPIEGRRKKSLTLITAVLDSHEVVRRQLLHLGRILTAECELIVVDDGSEPPLRDAGDPAGRPFDFTLAPTHDPRPWTQPRARNLGASLARTDKLLFFDIDHIVTREVVELGLEFAGDKLHWLRIPGILDEGGAIVTDRLVLLEHGLVDDAPSVHGNSFLIRRDLFRELGGYDERFCGRYGGDDVDFNGRYDRFVAAGRARPAEVRGRGYVYPDPARDAKGLFHALSRGDAERERGRVAIGLGESGSPAHGH